MFSVFSVVILFLGIFRHGGHGERPEASLGPHALLFVCWNCDP